MNGNGSRAVRFAVRAAQYRSARYYAGGVIASAFAKATADKAR
jgi:hypothetical protein